MKVKMFTVYDSKAETYGNPFFMRSSGEAIRGFSDEANRQSDSAVAAHPEDYTLFELGEYDTDLANFVILEAKKSLGCAIDFVKPKMEEERPSKAKLKKV